MRKAELIMALVMTVFSIYLMWKSTELPIGWIRGSGPGGGAFPFWLAAGMLVCCVFIIVNWVRRASPPAQSDDVYMKPEGFRLFLIVGGLLTAMIALIHIIGVYFSVPLFLIAYMRILGKHSWKVIGSIAAVTPVATFLFFEIALRKTLPKGFTEPLFYPLYEFFY